MIRKNFVRLFSQIYRRLLSFRIISPEVMNESFVFQQNETYNLRSGNYSAQKNIQTTQYGNDSISNLGVQL